MVSVLIYILFGFILRKKNIISTYNTKILGMLNFVFVIPLFWFSKIPAAISLENVYDFFFVMVLQTTSVVFLIIIQIICNLIFQIDIRATTALIIVSSTSATVAFGG